MEIVQGKSALIAESERATQGDSRNLSLIIFGSQSDNDDDGKHFGWASITATLGQVPQNIYPCPLVSHSSQASLALSVSPCLSVSLSVCLSVNMAACQSLSQFVYLARFTYQPANCFKCLEKVSLTN